tara:strand:+ start:564 stop:1382 length:819 start_codon:yes stop_codon:yes gene_type:complete
MSSLNEPINNIETKFNDKLGHSEKILRIKPKLFSQLISVFIILDALMFFTQTFLRWGAPCFLWWNYISTTITFLFSHGIRLIGIPVGIFGFYSIRRKNLDGIRLLFFFLLFSSFISALDIFLSLFEVHNVCNSKEIKEWNDCSHEWGKQEYICIDDNNVECLVGLIYNNMESDKEKCLENNCHYIKNTNLVKPQCCDDSLWNYHNPCSRDPQIRNKIFDTNWCENFSDFYDIGVQLATSAILLGFTYVVHSYKILMNEEDFKFTPNPAVGEE